MSTVSPTNLKMNGSPWKTNARVGSNNDVKKNKGLRRRKVGFKSRVYS